MSTAGLTLHTQTARDSRFLQLLARRIPVHAEDLEVVAPHVRVRGESTPETEASSLYVGGALNKRASQKEPQCHTKAAKAPADERMTLLTPKQVFPRSSKCEDSRCNYAQFFMAMLYVID